MANIQVEVTKQNEELTTKAQLKTIGREMVSAAKKTLNLALFLDFMKHLAIALVVALVAFGITMVVATPPVALLVFGVVTAALAIPFLIRSIIQAITLNSAINNGTKAVSTAFDAMTGAQVKDAVKVITAALTTPAAQIDKKPTVPTTTAPATTTATTTVPATTPETASVASKGMFATTATTAKDTKPAELDFGSLFVPR